MRVPSIEKRVVSYLTELTHLLKGSVEVVHWGIPSVRSLSTEVMNSDHH